MFPARSDRWTVGWLVTIFMASGATSLIYQTIWARHLNTIFGTSQLAISTLLATFMGGLALGAFVAGRHAHRTSRPIVVYAALEAFIAGYALVLPLLITLVTPIYLGFWRTLEPSPFVFGLFQFCLMGLVLLPPTMCMGATLPLLARFAARRREDAGRQVGRLYGANTIGAVIGTALGGFVLLPMFGLTTTTWLAAGANGILAIAALTLSRSSTLGAIKDEAPNMAPASTVANARTLLMIAAIGGFCGLLYEVAWFRLMVLVLGGSVYAFSLMLLAFLLGIGLGGWGAGASADRVWARAGSSGVLARVALLQVGVALVSWASMFAYAELPFAFVWLQSKLVVAPALLWPAKLGLALLIMTPPAVLMGATFPYLVRAAAGPDGSIARVVGRLYGVNTIGAVLGASVGGFVLLPLLHVRGSVLGAASLNLIAAVIAITAAGVVATTPNVWRRLAPAAAVAALAIGLGHVFKPPWNPLLMSSGMYMYAHDLSSPTRAALHEQVQGTELVYYDEGLSSVVTVMKHAGGEMLWLANNGKVDASSDGDRVTEVLLAHVPFAVRPDPERVLVIGLASGITAGSITLHRAPRRIDIVELEPSIIDACHAFDAINHRPLDDPRVHLYLNDARNHLLLQDDGAYDLVSSEPSNPWLTGVSNLFTQEFFELGKRKLAADGIWSQWLHMYSMSPDDLCSLLATFSGVFEHVRLFRFNESDLMLLGSDAPLPLDARTIATTFRAHPDLKADLKSIGVNRPADLLALYQLDAPAIAAMTDGIGLNTDDNMRIEYSAPLAVGVYTVGENLALLDQFTDVPVDAIDTTETLIDLAIAYALSKDMRRADETYRMAQTAAPDHPRVAELHDRFIALRELAVTSSDAP